MTWPPCKFPLTLLSLAGAVALLLWGVHMVQTGVQRAALILAEEKEVFRELEGQAAAAHFERGRESGASQAAGLNLDLLRDLKRVNAHLVASAAYPVLESHGELMPSRLRRDT